jgi:hypothetical protein
VNSFDVQKYGTLSGRLLQVSRDSIEDKNPGLVYETYVHSEKMQVMVEGVETPATTGMSVTAEIKVGKRRSRLRLTQSGWRGGNRLGGQGFIAVFVIATNTKA